MISDAIFKEGFKSPLALAYKAEVIIVLEKLIKNSTIFSISVLKNFKRGTKKP